MEIVKVRTNWPSCLSLPISIIEENSWEFFRQPSNCVWIASFSNKMESFKLWEIIFLNEFTFVVHLFNNSHSCWSSIDAMASMLRSNSPKCSRVRSSYRFSFKHDSSCSSNKRSVNNKRMTNNPSNITCGKESCIDMDIKDFIHRPIQCNNSPSCISHNTFWLTSCTWSIKDVKFMIRRKRYWINIRCFCLHFMVIVKPMWILSYFSLNKYIMSLND